MAFRWLIAVCFVGACVVVPSAVDAQTVIKVCKVDPITRDTACHLVWVDTSSAGVVEGSGSGGASLFRWQAEHVGFGGSTYCAEQDGVVGLAIFMRMYRVDTGALVSTQALCVWSTDDVIAAIPPPPPTPSELVTGKAAVLTLDPKILPPPAGTGSFGTLVQFESVGWCEYPGPAVVDISLRGWTAHAVLEPVSSTWTVSGPEPFSQTVLSGGGVDGVCGVPQTPSSFAAGAGGAAFRWTPHQAGEYEVTLDVTWAGTAQFTYLGYPAGDVDLGEHVFSESVSQIVNEAQAVAVGGG